MDNENITSPELEDVRRRIARKIAKTKSVK